ncbi:MAG TPA: 5,10-methylenetetrahydrofolate reductase [Dehalococcoidia bacterium]|nr:5,10-methylenetetrahydrofolate reductase [Dehalococcoidia bacterium]
MIVSAQKPWEEILGYLEGENSIFLLGCNGCAQASGSGGPEQVAEMKEKLEGVGKKVSGTMVIDFLCQKALVKSRLRPRMEQVAAADSILVMTCGLGVQAVAASVAKVCHPACDTVNMGGSRGEWKGDERCYECGECLLEYTGGICPLTACTKSLTNGACGGASNGKCELAPEKDCGWELIYERLKRNNQLDKLRRFIPPKSWDKMAPDPKVRATARWALENSG